MAFAGYDTEKVKDFLKEQFRGVPRGTQARLCRATGINQASVSRWAAGVDCPTPRYWPAIEEVLGLPQGSIAKAGGVTHAAVKREALRAEVETLKGQIETLQSRLEWLDQQLAQPRRARR